MQSPPKRILLRAAKAPTDRLDAEDVYRRNLISNNNGNLLFTTAAYKLLSTTDTTIHCNGFDFDPADAPRVNEEYDAVVLPLANAFRPGFRDRLRQLTGFVSALKIPVIMLSGGAQSGPDGGFANLTPMRDDIAAFCRAVLDRSTRLGVRGERTEAYLHTLGFKDTAVIGCPSMAMFGPSHSVPNPVISEDTLVACNVETSVDRMGAAVADAELNYRAVYFPQDLQTLGLMLWGSKRSPMRRDRRLPIWAGHPQFRSGTAEFMLDADSWIGRLRSFDFSFGTRIHGNIAALLAGVPSLTIPHDSRTAELAEYHQLPRYAPAREEFMTVAQLVEWFSADAMNRATRPNFERLRSFLHENGLESIFDPGQEQALRLYESTIQQNLPQEPVRCRWVGLDSQDRRALWRQRPRHLEPALRRRVTNRAARAIRRHHYERLRASATLGNAPAGAGQDPPSAKSRDRG